MGKNCSVTREVMERHQEIRSDASLVSAIGIIAEHQYVLVRGHDQKISGIVTASDLSLQFQQMAEPFLLLGEIENHLRLVISQKFTPTELKSAKDPADTKRIVTSSADLTYGEYKRLLENPERWDKLNITVDRKPVWRRLRMYGESEMKSCILTRTEYPKRTCRQFASLPASFRGYRLSMQ